LHSKFRLLAWIALLAAVATVIYGIVSTRLFDSDTWWPEGYYRFRYYTITFTLAAAAFFLFGRRYFVGVVVALVVAGTVRGVGPAAFFTVALLVFSCIVLGRALFGAVNWAAAFLGGLCLWALAVAFLAHVPVHYAAVYLGLQGAIILWRRTDAVDLARQLRRAVGPGERFSAAQYWAAFLFVYTYLAHWFLVWKPESGGDALSVHLAIAFDFARNHRFTFDFRSYIWALNPLGADFCYALAVVPGGEYAGRLLNFVMLGVSARLIYASCKAWVPPATSLVLASLFISSPITQLVTGSMMVENFTAALSIGSAYVIWRFWDQPSPRSICLAALLLGSLVGWKLGGFAIAAVLLPLLIAAIRRTRNGDGKRPVWAVALAAVTFLIPGLQPYVKAYVFSGNPIFPFPNRFFKSPYMEDALADFRFHEPLTWRSLYDLTFYSTRYYEGQNGSFGYAYLPLLMLSIVAIWKIQTSKAVWAVAAGWIALAIILAGVPNARYTYPALPLILVGGAVVLATLALSDLRLYRAAMVCLLATAALNVWFLPTSNWYHRDFFLRPLFADRGRQEYIRFHAPIREVASYVNDHTTGPVLIVRDSEIGAIRQPTYSNNWHNWNLHKQLRSLRRASDFQSLATELGIHYFIAPKQREKDEVEATPAVFDFLDACTAPEFETDKFQVLRTLSNCTRRLEAAGRNDTLILRPGRYDDMDPRIGVTGIWLDGRDFPEAYEGTVTYSHQAGAAIEVQFEGSAVIYGYTKAFNRGIAEVLLDGELIDRLDSYSPDVIWQASKRYVAKAPGRHRLVIRPLNQKSPESQAAFVDLDFIQIEPAPPSP
jgi:hypothetical protein